VTVSTDSQADIEFGEQYEKYRRQVKVLARLQRVPGLDADDVEVEMLVCIWKAVQTFDPSNGLDFGGWWWTLWLNRRSDISEAFYADKRPRPLSCDPAIMNVVADQAEAMVVVPACPTTGRADSAVWSALANGRTVSQAMEEAEVSRRGFYNILRGWRTPVIRNYLQG
jgi:hypothetical protein